jgi:hypothetical protein
MTRPNLIGLLVRIRLSDPWELGEGLDWAPLDGTIVMARTGDGRGRGPAAEAAIVRLDRPFVHAGTHCELFHASPRHQGGRLDALLSGRGVPCGLTRLPPERLTSTDPFDLTWWRGGVAAIGTVEPREAGV